jgi:OOP family OmpA-OmpF porin
MAGSISGQAAKAAELGFYVGGAYGNGSKDIARSAFDQSALGIFDFFGFLPAGGTSSIDPDNRGYGFTAGYRLTPHLAVEGGYTELGKVTYRARVDGDVVVEQFFREGPATVNLSSQAKTGGFALSALGILPLSYRWEMYGRAGIMFSSNELTLFITDSEFSYKAQPTGSSTDFLAGAGISFTFAEIYSFRGEYQRVFDAGDDDTVGEGDADLVTLGITVKF